MAYHIKKQSVLLNSKTVYYKGNSSWSDVYADRKLHDYAHSAEFDGGEGCTVVEDSSYTP